MLDASTILVFSTPSVRGRGMRRGSVAIGIPFWFDDATSVPVSTCSLPNSAHSIFFKVSVPSFCVPSI